MPSTLLENIKKNPPTILVLGDIMLDRFIYGDAERISPEAPIPVVSITNEKQMLGGCGNVITNLNNIGIKTIPFCVVGKDNAGDLLIEKFLNQRIPVSNIFQVKKVMTTEKIRVVADNQQIVRIDKDMTNLGSEYVDIFTDNFLKFTKNIDCVIISDYAKGVCQEKLIKKIISISTDHKIPILVDPKGANWMKYKHASLITPNVKEVENILGEKLTRDKDYEIAAKKICSTYKIDACLITKGAEGMSFFSKDDVFHLKSNAKEVFDVSGAGDTVIAMMAAGVVANLSYKQAAQFSNQAAGVVVGNFGTSAITMQELLKLY